MSRLSQSAAEFWTARNPRERSVLIIGAALLLLALLWLWLIDPAVQGRNQWQKNLPVLRAQVAQMQALAREVSAAPAAKNVASVVLSRSMLEQSLAAKNIKPQELSISQEQVRLKLADVPFSSIVDWLGEMQTSAQLIVTDASITARNGVDQVDASFSLHQLRP